ASSIGHRRAVRCPLFPYTTLFRSRLTYFYQLLRSAGIDAGLTEEIEPVIWTKFLFISSAAASTCYFNATFGQIRSNRDFFDTFRSEEHTSALQSREKLVCRLLPAK